MMEHADLNQVQPIDAYVRNLLEIASQRFGVQIDLENPTRGQRLEAAMAMKDESDGFSSMEIMVGRCVGTEEAVAKFFTVRKLAEAISGKPISDLRQFYAGFTHQYWSKDQ